MEKITMTWVIKFILGEIKHFFKYLHRLWKGDYRPVSAEAFGISSYLTSESGREYGLVDKVFINDELYLLLINDGNPDEAVIKKFVVTDDEDRLVDVDKQDEFDSAWRIFTSPCREKSEEMNRLLHYWKYGEAGTGNEMKCAEYFVKSYILNAGTLLWLYIFNITNIRVAFGEILLSAQQSEVLFFGICLGVLSVLTTLSLKNNRNYGYVWSNAFIAIGLAMATKLLFNYSVIVVILLTLWILLTSVCIYRFKKDKKKSGNGSAQVIKQKWRCVLRLSRNALTAMSVCFFILVIFR